jgi:hypothetical protein
MSTDLNIHLSPEAFDALQQAAIATGRTPSEEAASAVEQKFGTHAVRSSLTDQEARERFERHFGTVSFGYPSDVTNEQIDADLAREYGRTHDGD